jgi:hypothetical protein
LQRQNADLNHLLPTNRDVKAAEQTRARIALLKSEISLQDQMARGKTRLPLKTNSAATTPLKN